MKMFYCNLRKSFPPVLVIFGLVLLYAYKHISSLITGIPVWHINTEFCVRYYSIFDTLLSLIAPLFSTDLVILLLTSIAVFVFYKTVRDSWSKYEIIFFVIVTNWFPLFICAIFVVILSLGPICYSGGAAFIASTTVVAAQFDPDRLIIGFNNRGLRSQFACFYTFLLLFVLSQLGAVEDPSVFLYISGFFFSWFYLRFLQYHTYRKYGDHRSGFTFASFFPGILGRLVAAISNVLYTAFLDTKLCPGIERRSEIVSTASFAVNIPGLTADAERHRQLALKVLNERWGTFELAPSSPDDTVVVPVSEVADAQSLAVLSESVDWPSLDAPGGVPTGLDTNLPASLTVDVKQEVHVDSDQQKLA